MERSVQRFTTRIEPRERPTLVVVLPYDQRQKSRLRTVASNGEEIAIVLPRGTTLRHGDWLVGESGDTLAVRAAVEKLSRARTDDPHLLARAAYHLGNRHVPLEIAPGRLSYQPDHVLDAMLRELGIAVSIVTERFEPEPGAYSAGHSHHSHSSHEGSTHEGGSDEVSGHCNRVVP